YETGNHRVPAEVERFRAFWRRRACRTLESADAAVLNYHGLVLGRGSAGPVDYSNVLESDQGSIDAHEAFDRIRKLGLRQKSFAPKQHSHGQNQRSQHESLRALSL